MSDTTKPNLGVCVPCYSDNHADCTGPVSSIGCKCSLTHELVVEEFPTEHTFTVNGVVREDITTTEQWLRECGVA